jgi:apolipoprotein N-acyltransferase
VAQEAEMTSQHTKSQNGRLFVGVAITGLVFAALFCKLNGAPAHSCQLLGRAVWAASEVLRLVLTLAKWHPLAAYLYENSPFVQNLLQIGASIWPLVSVIAG